MKYYTSVEAFQWDPDPAKLPDWLVQAFRDGKANTLGGEPVRLEVVSPQGRMIADPGEYIIKGEHGLTVMAQKDFEEQYNEPHPVP